MITQHHFFRAGIPFAFFLVGFSAVGVAATINATYTTAIDIPVTANGYVATGNAVSFTLAFAPATGTELTVVRNTGLGFIAGTFDNLTNGQRVALIFNGTAYPFVANYFGGSGNDLVLVWANSRPFGWGDNYDGELGNGTRTEALTPTPMETTGVLAGKTVLGLAVGSYHTLVLCSDGIVASCGFNEAGQLGDNGTTRHLLPVAVDTTAGVSALYGKQVVAVAAGFEHSLALCSDGTVAAWGNNYSGQLGDNSTATRLAAVAVNTSAGFSALSGKKVVAIAACNDNSLALCSDGTVVSWGRNTYGQLGNGTTTPALVPVAVNTSAGVSALYGKTVVRIASASGHALALCSDGTLAAWGCNDEGELGNNSTTSSLVPVAVNTTEGVSALYGKTVVDIAAGAWHSQALCSDSTVVTWGYNTYGQLGDGSTLDRWVPVAVESNPGSALFGKLVTAISMGSWCSLALCSDGTIAGWGLDNSGQLGNGVTQDIVASPVAADMTPLSAGERFVRLATGSYGNHTQVLVASPVANPITLTGAQMLPNGAFQFNFVATPGGAFSILTATNPAAPLTGWTPLTGLTEVSPGHFQFTDSQAPGNPRRFYTVRSP